MKKLLLLFLLVQLGTQLKAQWHTQLKFDGKDFIVKEGEDTILCTITFLRRANGNIFEIEYQDLQKKSHVIEEKDIDKVKSLRMHKYTMDYVPLKGSNKPGAFRRHLEKRIDGKIKVYMCERVTVNVDRKGERWMTEGSASGGMIYNIWLDNGEFYPITGSNIKKIIAPHMMKCKAFTDSFKETVNKKNLEEAVKLYNKVCG